MNKLNNPNKGNVYIFILPYPSNTANMYLQYTYHIAIVLIGNVSTIQIRYTFNMFVEIFEFISDFIFVIFNIE